ncbi:methyltransferase domain-containing protein [Henriciella aquimarina]|uniref:methyltransferase domain-containing protein n=1 Tax=Henriciella aquimarina TaxID=545261 RepID=UPI001301B02C|nr:methyltransferase domain-containing protein [Henriciella aquimarina]
MDRETVREYYGETLGGTEDLKTSACCSTVRPPDPVLKALDAVHPNVKARFYGCGVVVPEADMTGWHVVDLGSGSGQDVYVLAQLVGEGGSVTGVDMTPQQLDVARAHEDWHRERFNYARSNVRFLDGFVDELETLAIEPASIDLVVSNCVINLVADKAKVFAGVASILKPGGRFLFSDVFADKAVPADVAADPVVRGECLGGAMTLEQFETLREAADFVASAWREVRPLSVDDPDIAAKLAGHSFESRTVELMKR